jgi:hypothetical protein
MSTPPRGAVRRRIVFSANCLDHQEEGADAAAITDQDVDIHRVGNI